MDTIRSAYEEFAEHVDPSEYGDQGDRVVVRGRFTGKNKGGAELDTGFALTPLFDEPAGTDRG